MSLVNKIFLDSVVVIFTAFPLMLFVVWVMTKGWRYEPAAAKGTRPPGRSTPE